MKSDILSARVYCEDCNEISVIEVLYPYEETTGTIGPNSYHGSRGVGFYCPLCSKLWHVETQSW